MNENTVLEASIGKTGKEWEVTIIGAKSPNDVVTIDGRSFIQSDNGRLYDISALANSAQQWEGVEVYDNHQTEEEYQKTRGMRSPSADWVGTIVKPR